MNDLPVRFCPACGHIGATTHRDPCCPDADNARYVPHSVALYEEVKLRHTTTKELDHEFLATNN